MLNYFKDNIFKRISSNKYIYRNYYFNIVYNKVMNILNNLVDTLLITKNNVLNYIGSYKDEYKLNNVYLISNDINYDISNKYFKIDVKKYFDRNIEIVNRKTIDNIIDNLKLEKIVKIEKNTRLIFEYSFNGKEYKFIYSYYLIDKEENIENDVEVDYPFYNKKIIEKIKVDKDKSGYINFLKMNCKDIEYVKINNVNIDKEIIEKFQGPYYDFGGLIKINIKLEWILKDMQFNEKLDKFEIKFSNPYLDEENFDLIEHYIILNKCNNIIKSGLMNKFIINL